VKVRIEHGAINSEQREICAHGSRQLSGQRHGYPLREDRPRATANVDRLAIDDRSGLEYLKRPAKSSVKVSSCRESDSAKTSEPCASAPYEAMGLQMIYGGITREGRVSRGATRRNPPVGKMVPRRRSTDLTRHRLSGICNTCVTAVRQRTYGESTINGL